MDTKRRLPVLKTPEEPDEADARPPWQWIGFGTLAIFVVWVPFAYAAGVVAARLQSIGSPLGAVLGVQASGLAIAATAGGYLVGRWGGKDVGLREAALAGLAASLVAAGLSLGVPGAWAGALVVVLVAVAFAALGGRLGLRRRHS